MYFFGIAALDRFKTKLKDYPQYCQVCSLNKLPNCVFDSMNVLLFMQTMDRPLAQLGPML
jgi:hypothetical protein